MIETDAGNSPVEVDDTAAPRAAPRAYGFHVHDPDGDTVHRPTETLQAGSSRPAFFEKVPAKWRRRGVVLFALVLGLAAGAGAVLEWQEQPASPTLFRADEHAVELVLFEAVAPSRQPNGRPSGISALQLDGALLLSGQVTSTVMEVGTLDRSLDVRAPALPVTVTPTGRFQPVSLEITVRDCKAATRWTPGDRPFTVTWEDEYNRTHLDRAGDFSKSMARSLVRYIDSVCGGPRSESTGGNDD